MVGTSSLSSAAPIKVARMGAVLFERRLPLAEEVNGVDEDEARHFVDVLAVEGGGNLVTSGAGGPGVDLFHGSVGRVGEIYAADLGPEVLANHVGVRLEDSFVCLCPEAIGD